MDFRTLIWLLPVALALHEAEEWNIHGWYQRNFVDLPAGRTKTTIRFFLVFLSIVGFIWTGTAALWGKPSSTAIILLPLVALIAQNVIQHIYWHFYFGQYAPGILTAVLVLGPLVAYFVFVSLAQGLVPEWYVILLGALMLPGLVETIRARNRLTQAIVVIHKFSRTAVKRLGIQDADSCSQSRDAA